MIIRRTITKKNKINEVFMDVMEKEMKKKNIKMICLMLSLGILSSCGLKPMGQKEEEKNTDTTVASQAGSIPSGSSVPNEDKFITIAENDARSDESKKAVESSMLNEKAEGEFVSYEEFRTMEDAEDIKNGIWQMTDKVFSEVNKESKKQNVVFSPISLFNTMAVLREGANGAVKDSLSEIMGIKPETDISKSMNAFTRLFNTVVRDENGNPTRNGYALSTGLFIDKDFKPATDFLQDITDNYMSEAATLDFSDTAASENIINSWIKERSRGFLDKGTPPDPSTVMDIVNVFVINNMWYSGFQPAGDISFKTQSGETKNVPAMEKKGFNAFVLRGDNYTAYNSTLKGGGNVWLILPDEGTDPMDIKNIQEIVSSDASEMEHVVLNITIPQVAIEKSDTDLKAPLTTLGYGSIFEKGADFSGIADGLFVSSLNQSTKLMVDKEGFRAGTVTDIQLAGAAPLKDFEVVDMNFNIPYLIVAESYGMPQFVIKIGDPAER